MMMGGMRRMGAGRTARVTAVSFTALLAATTEVPTARPTSSTTTIPSLSSWFRIRIAFRVLAVAAERERAALASNLWTSTCTSSTPHPQQGKG